MWLKRYEKKQKTYSAAFPPLCVFHLFFLYPHVRSVRLQFLVEDINWSRSNLHPAQLPVHIFKKTLPHYNTQIT
jgi:hypothetical protein